jgi:hypothetical protein
VTNINKAARPMQERVWIMELPIYCHVGFDPISTNLRGLAENPLKPLSTKYTKRHEQNKKYAK